MNVGKYAYKYSLRRTCIYPKHIYHDCVRVARNDPRRLAPVIFTRKTRHVPYRYLPVQLMIDHAYATSRLLHICAERAP